MDIAVLIQEAIAEDIGTGDVTTWATVPETAQAVGRFEVKADGVICGLDVARQAMTAVDAALQWEAVHVDGDVVEAGTPVALVRGRARGILQAERIALNFLGHLSGIATSTHRFVQCVAGTPAQVLDTRKTLPGWRALEKYAVAKGGGGNHRQGLYDRYLVKSNHIDLHESLEELLEHLATQRRPDLLLEVEARDLEEAEAAAAFGVDIILLDNFPLRDVQQAIAAVAGRAKIEVSGGITLENVRAYAEAGADYISVGALTHSAPVFDIHLVVSTVPSRG